MRAREQVLRRGTMPRMPLGDSSRWTRLPLSLTHKRTVALTMWMSNGCAAAISDSSRSLKPIQKIFEDAKNLRHAVAVGSSASQIGIKVMSAISVKVEGH